MGKFGGFGGGGMGGMGNMQQLMKQAQKMQEDMAKAKEELAETEVTGTSGGGMVEIVMNCHKNVISCTIKPEACDPDDIEMLEDLIVAAFNDACEEADTETANAMGPYSQLGM